MTCTASAESSNTLATEVLMFAAFRCVVIKLCAASSVPSETTLISAVTPAKVGVRESVSFEPSRVATPALSTEGAARVLDGDSSLAM